MPKYCFHCKDCDSVFEKWLSLSNYKQPISEPCPDCKKENSIESYIATDQTTVAIGDFIKLGLKKPSNLFRERMTDLCEKTGNKGKYRFS